MTREYLRTADETFTHVDGYEQRAVPEQRVVRSSRVGSGRRRGFGGVRITARRSITLRLELKAGSGAR
jgi:hypothetical protein